MKTPARVHSASLASWLASSLPSSLRALFTAWLVLAALVPGSVYRWAPASASASEPAAAVPAAAAAGDAKVSLTVGATAPAAPAGAAVAVDATAAAAASAAPAAPAAPAAASGGAADLNFDLLDEGKKPAGPSLEEVKRRQLIERQVRIRRPMLIAHQAIGFVTLAALAATVVIGHLNYYDKYQSGDFSGRYEKAHEGLGIATSITFGTTGLLAVFAPNPYPKPVRLDTALVHKISMILATAGMVTQIILGPITANRVGRLNQGDLALGHVVTGYATWAFMATGTVAYFF